MRRLLACLSLAALALAPLAVGPASAARAGDCRKGAIEKLRASAPDGYAVFEEMKDKKFFLDWISCDDVQLGLPTAVHESVHYLTADADAFPLVGGGEIERPHEVSRFYAPSRLVGTFKSDDFVATYLKPGRASSSSDFLYLLDELNAYTHDLNAAIDLKDLHRAGVYADNRDGLAALMAFVALYVERAEASEPATWQGLEKPEVAKTVAELWGRAEKVMASSCGIPHFGTEDKAYIRQYCRAETSSLQTLLGRAPLCPTDCLKADPPIETVDEAIDSGPPDPVTRTIWSRRASHRAPSNGSASGATSTSE